MRHKLICLSLTMMSGMALQSSFAESHDVNRVDAHNAKIDYRSKEIIVKFNQSSGIEISQNRSGKILVKAAKQGAAEKALTKLGVLEASPLMPLTGGEIYAKVRSAYNGKPVNVQPMTNTYLLKIDSEDYGVTEAVEMLANLDEVEYAEPNYIAYALEAQTPDDPYYSLQYGIKDINLFNLWGMPVLSKEGPVIAILDTGVDIYHPDLNANIWTNSKEINGAKGYDDDNNGFKDDFHGWDFVNQTGEINDYNGHGTHCAGIAAACGYNGIGIIGANPHARIMPLTVLQSNGQGDIATIIKALDYAVANGATVISMSLGSYSTSKAFEEALARAYQKAVIVAAAGNDGYCINHPHRERGQNAPMPMFPAAYQFVLGVQASSDHGGLAGFSNYDDNGSTFSEYSEAKLYNYELMVPGVTITSTFPGGGYKALNGTSMATPLVAGAVSRLLQSKEYKNKDELFGDLINSTNPSGNLDIYGAFKIQDGDRKPEIQFVTIDMVDADGDGRADAGEVVEFYPVIRNSWGSPRNIKVKIECAETVNNSIEIIEGTADFGLELSSYGKGRSLNPLKIKFNRELTDGRNVRLKFTAVAENATEIEKCIDVKVENAVELTGLMSEDIILTPDQHYVVVGAFGVPADKTLTILPGTTLKFRDDAYFVANGKVIANGEPGKMITFTKADLDLGNVYPIDFGTNDISYCEFYDFNFKDRNNTYSVKAASSSYCIFHDCSAPYAIDRNIWKYSSLYNLTARVGLQTNGVVVNSNVVNCNGGGRDAGGRGYFLGIEGSGNQIKCCNVFHNLLRGDDFEDDYGYVVRSNTPTQFRHDYPIYVGTGDLEIAKHRVVDINHPDATEFGTLAMYDFSVLPSRPYADAPGIVWKVVVNGYDAQDQFDEMPALGIGTHKFEIYFNRPMNKEVAPLVAMGVRAPYTQIAIGEDCSWNEAGDIYTAYITINGKGSIDGLNRIYVAGAEDNQFFKIPVEDSRFNVMVQAAGALSDGFMAEAGLGRVNLEWENTEENFDDMLGLNMYRYEIDEEGNGSEPTRINTRLIETNVTEMTDFDVKPRKTYAYFYKIMRTDLAETSPSKTVAVTPLTAAMGDANGSGSVDVADVVTTVNYASGKNPMPFIFEAADMNVDKEIDILDVVGIIRSILSPSSVESAAVADTAYYSIDEFGVLYLQTPQAVGGVQLNLLMGDNGKVSAEQALDGFEQTGARINDNEYIFMAYNMSGKYIAPGLHPIARIADADVQKIILSDMQGRNIEVVRRDMNDIITGIKDINSVVSYGKGIFTIGGYKLSDDISTLERLPQGIYVVNGKKIAK